jgi:hypothetical protein
VAVNNCAVFIFAQEQNPEVNLCGFLFKIIVVSKKR